MNCAPLFEENNENQQKQNYPDIHKCTSVSREFSDFLLMPETTSLISSMKFLKLTLLWGMLLTLLLLASEFQKFLKAIPTFDSYM